ncbi:MAG: metallophosphoesterase [Terracidiphilus sp.]
MIKQFRDPRLSLWQSAIDEAVVSASQRELKKSATGIAVFDRPDQREPLVRDTADFCAALDNHVPEQELEKGVMQVVGRCSNLAFKAASTFIKNLVLGYPFDENEARNELMEKFGSCDSRYADAAILYAKFLTSGSHIPYRTHVDLSDFVIEDLPEAALIGLVADWGTGQGEARIVLQQVAKKNPNIVIHLGDIYYAGTEFEVQNYFYRPWRSILGAAGNPRSFSLAGNHDMYSGGMAYYSLLDQLAQPASYFCLRNKYWQVIGIDTGVNAKFGVDPTTLKESEAEWLVDKIENRGNRKTILLSHHQLFSADEKFVGQSFNIPLYKQVASVLGNVDIWLWGHEHNLVIYEPYMNLRRARCIGCGAFPVGKEELPSVHVNADVPCKTVSLARRGDFYQHGYAMIQLDGPNASAAYFQDGDEQNPLYKEDL